MSYLGGDGVSFCHCYRVTSATQTVDEGISPVNPHPDLKAAVVIAKRRGLEQGGGVLLALGLRLHH